MSFSRLYAGLFQRMAWSGTGSEDAEAQAWLPCVGEVIRRRPHGEGGPGRLPCRE